jgi:predicted RNA-binding Zn-ribbon protein involved in translation (DUF1610 family)
MEQERIDEKIKELEVKAQEEREQEATQPDPAEKDNVVEMKRADPSKVVTQCPACGKKQRVGDQYGIIATRYCVFMGPGKEPIPSLTKYACPHCGVESFRGEDLLRLRMKAEQAKNLIMVPEPQLRTQ